MQLEMPMLVKTSEKESLSLLVLVFQAETIMRVVLRKSL
jgi:hypothetical protein